MWEVIRTKGDQRLWDWRGGQRCPREEVEEERAWAPGGGLVVWGGRVQGRSCSVIILGSVWLGGGAVTSEEA